MYWMIKHSIFLNIEFTYTFCSWFNAYVYRGIFMARVSENLSKRILWSCYLNYEIYLKCNIINRKLILYLEFAQRFKNKDTYNLLIYLIWLQYFHLSNDPQHQQIERVRESHVLMRYRKIVENSSWHYYNLWRNFPLMVFIYSSVSLISSKEQLP